MTFHHFGPTRLHLLDRTVPTLCALFGANRPDTESMSEELNRVEVEAPPFRGRSR
jgi:hypothetical protein